MAKPLAYSRPRGQNLIIEWDIFFPLPSTWRQPQVQTKPPKPKKTTTKIPFHEEIHEVESWTPPGEVWKPESGWKNDIFAEINKDPHKASRRIDEVNKLLQNFKFSN